MLCLNSIILFWNEKLQEKIKNCIENKNIDNERKGKKKLKKILVGKWANYANEKKGN